MNSPNWTTKEQLCLASAVSCSGDQNWMSVSRSVKLLCGGNGSRPTDWYSQKNCAVQYGHMLENVETPKRKKRSSESGISSPAPVETPTDLILRRLTEERIQELKADIRKRQEEYKVCYEEVKAIQAGQVPEERLWEMWREMEQQLESQRIAEMKKENQIRERELRKLDVQRSWRQNVGLKSTVDNTVAVDMDVEEIIGSGKSINSSSSAINNTNNGISPSPLLSSLLKSPNGNNSNNNSAIAGVSGFPTGVRAAVTAPTITTLLTSGSIPNANAPVLTLKKSVPIIEGTELLSRPISGPPTDTLPISTTPSQNLMSPSQSAPTLSMLLEKNKTTVASNSSSFEAGSQSNSESIKTGTVENTSSVSSDKEEANSDINKESVPMEIEEQVQTVSIVNSTDLDNINETNLDTDGIEDFNDEQQLMEVFKNIGIDELDIDVAAVMGVDDEPTTGSPMLDFGIKIGKDSGENKERAHSEPVTDEKTINTEVKNIKKEQEEVSTKEESSDKEIENDETQEEKVSEIAEDAEKENFSEDQSSETTSDVIALEDIQLPSEKHPSEVPQNSSSDDSNDNIPLASVVTGKMETKSTKSQDSDINSEENLLLDNKKDELLDAETEDVKDVSIESLSPKDNEPAELPLKLDLNVSQVKSDDSDTEDTNNNTEELSKDAEEDKKSLTQVSPTENIDKEEKTEVAAVETDFNDDIFKSEKLQNCEQGFKIEIFDDSESKTVTSLDESEPLQGDPLDVRECTVVIEDTELEPDANEEEEEIVAETLPPPAARTMSTTVDTDYDSSTTDASITTRKDEGVRSSNRRRSQRNLVDEDSQSSSTTNTPTQQGHPVRPPIIRKLRDRDRSESPLIEHENDPLSTSGYQRPRRRYSSTPVRDSVPNSPASASDRDDSERELRCSKKSLLSIYNALQPQKYTSLFQRIVNPEYNELVEKFGKTNLRPMSWQTIKRNIDNGHIRSPFELQRDFLLMCNNALMILDVNSIDYKAVRNIMIDSQSMREFLMNPNNNEMAPIKIDKETNRKSVTNKTKGQSTPLNTSQNAKGRGSRKSQRYT